MTPPPDPEPSEAVKPFKVHHTLVQKAILALNVIVILGCFAGAGALIVGKRVRESFVAAPHVPYGSDPATSVATPSVGTGTTVAGATVATSVPGDTAPTETFPAVDAKAENFLVTGDDNNACIDPNSPYAGAVEGRENIGNRSDTIMVIRLDPTTKAAAVLSFPRDLWVKIPGHGNQRINTTYQKGQYDLMAATLDQNFGVKVDHFVQIDFCAFKTIVDAVGGVSVPLPVPVRDKNTGLDIEDVSACHEFHGDEALAYVRSRHLQYLDTDGTWKTDGTSDFGRITRQQDFLRRMLQAANSRGLFSPSVVRGLISAVQKYVVFDNGFSIDDMLSFAGLLREIPPASLKTYQIQSKGQTISGAAVQIPQIDGANMKAILDIFRGNAALAAAPDQVADTTTTAPATTTTAPATTTSTVGAGRITTTTLAPTTTTTSTTPAPTTTAKSGGKATTTSSSTSSTSSSTTSTSTSAPTPSTSSTTSTSSTSTTVVTAATNPDDITHGIFPDKNAAC
jgi:LCP family protein required for cell wall assembly